MSEEKRHWREAVIKYLITDEDVDDIMCSALEGGFTVCWCAEVKPEGEWLGEYPSEQISRGGRLRFVLREPDDFQEPLILDMKRFLDGLDKYIKEYAFRYYGLDFIDADGWINPGNIDGVMADLIVQLALFGEVVYG